MARDMALPSENRNEKEPREGFTGKLHDLADKPSQGAVKQL